MERRKLLTVATDKTMGEVVVDNGKISFKGDIEDIFSGLRQRLGSDAALARTLMKDGWSNGYLYLGEKE